MAQLTIATFVCDKISFTWRKVDKKALENRELPDVLYRASTINSALIHDFWSAEGLTIIIS